MNHKTQISKFLAAVQAEIIKEQQRKDIKASGRSAKSLRIEADKDSGKLIGADYFESQEYGSPAGTVVSWKSLRDWLDTQRWAAGLQNIAKNAIAAVIKRNIFKRGTLRGNTTTYPGLGIADIIEKKKPILISEIRGERIKSISEIIRGAI